MSGEGGEIGSGDSDAASNAGRGETDPVGVRVRGIYTTALTHLLAADGETTVVQASPPIRERFDAPFPVEPAGASMWTTDDQQGVGLAGESAAVGTVARRLLGVGRDALAWRDPTPRGAVYAGEVAETLGSGAVVELTDATETSGEIGRAHV